LNLWSKDLSGGSWLNGFHLYTCGFGKAPLCVLIIFSQLIDVGDICRRLTGRAMSRYYWSVCGCRLQLR
jgi:hypothetical protein